MGGSTGNTMKHAALPPVTAEAFSPEYVERGEEMYFVNVLTGKKHLLVTKTGYISHFPGIEDHPDEDAQTRECIARCRRNPRDFFGLSFRTFGKENYRVWWIIQPEGRYWEDDTGYGATDDEEIMLYTLLDREGHYTGPFRLWRSNKKYYAWDYDNLYLRFYKDPDHEDGSRRVDVVDHQYVNGEAHALCRVNDSRVSRFRPWEEIIYGFSCYRNVEELRTVVKNQWRRRPPDNRNRTLLLEYREPMSALRTPADVVPYRHWMYLINGQSIDCLSWEDGGREVTVTMDVERVNAFVWKEMVRTGFTKDEDVCIVSMNYQILRSMKPDAAFWQMQGGA